VARNLVGSLVVGLALFLCAKASSAEDDADDAVDEMARFLERCRTLSEGWESATSMDPPKR
jgi:hypothetical protein